MIRRLGLLCLLLTLCPCLEAWGPRGHRLVNGAAIQNLPKEMGTFYGRHASELIRWSMEPDWAKDKDAQEGYRHYINLEVYSFKVPRSYDEAVRLYGPQTVRENGTVPWRIQEMFDRLTKAFAAKDAKAIVKTSAWLGHYVADVHVPFHATQNSDGQSTGNQGIHSRFEHKLLETHSQDIHIAPHEARLISDVWEETMTALRESHKLVKGILKADRRAHKASHGLEARYYDKLWKESGGTAQSRLATAADRLASLWFTAWFKAGQPDLSKLK